MYLINIVRVTSLTTGKIMFVLLEDKIPGENIILCKINPMKSNVWVKFVLTMHILIITFKKRSYSQNQGKCHEYT
jgi:hypothetical protein